MSLTTLADELLPSGDKPPIPSLNSELLREVNELRIVQHLYPAAKILSDLDNLSEDATWTAAGQARSALQLAQEVNASEALQGRCAYYLGIAEFILANKFDAASRPGTANSVDNWRAKPTTVPEYFEQALAAKGKYEEGTKAEAWVAYFSGEDGKSGSGNGRQGRRSWFGRVFDSLSLWRTQSMESTSDAGSRRASIASLGRWFSQTDAIDEDGEEERSSKGSDAGSSLSAEERDNTINSGGIQDS